MMVVKALVLVTATWFLPSVSPPVAKCMHLQKNPKDKISL
jgi:hypothetical protein